MVSKSNTGCGEPERAGKEGEKGTLMWLQSNFPAVPVSLLSFSLPLPHLDYVTPMYHVAQGTFSSEVTVHSPWPGTGRLPSGCNLLHSPTSFCFAH